MSIYAQAAAAAMAPFASKHERVTVRAMCLLMAIERSPGCTTSQYAKLLNIPTPAVTRNLNSLEPYIKQVINERDRRKVEIYLTETGAQVVHNLNDSMKDTVQRRGKNLAPPMAA